MKKVFLLSMLSFVLCMITSTSQARSSPAKSEIVMTSPCKCVVVAPVAINAAGSLAMFSVAEYLSTPRVDNLHSVRAKYGYIGKSGKVMSMKLQLLKINRCKNSK